MRVKFLAKVNNKAFDGDEPTTDQLQVRYATHNATLFKILLFLSNIIFILIIYDLNTKDKIFQNRNLVSS